jgi:arsenite methyltransferase
MARDLMYSEELKTLVRDAYGSVSEDTTEVAHKLYTQAELQGVPAESIRHALGVGNHLRFAEIEEGQTILDLGCGAGIDSVIAARRSGDEGRVIALDFLPEMLERTAKAAADAGLDNIQPLEGEMEAIPLPDNSVDHVISNGVINLSPRKGRVLAECARVLRPGGAFCISDLAVEENSLPPEVLTHPAAWAGWVSGALAERDFVEKLQKVGFVDVHVVHRNPWGIDDCELYPLFGDDLITLMRRLIPPESQGHVGESIVIKARLGA